MSSGATSRKRWLRPFALSLGAAVALTLAAPVFNMTSPAAHAVAEGLPTWDDVQEAKQNEAATAAKVTEIEALLVQVEREVEQTRAASAAAGAALAEAEEALLAANERVQALEGQAAESAAEAESAANEAASLISQLYRSGGVDRNVELFLESDGSTADELLERLAVMSKATERNAKVADEATRARNTAENLGQQAQAATDERQRLQEEAAARKQEAEVAAANAVETQTRQEEQKATLDAQLAALKDTTTETVSGYEERLRLEEEERRRIEAERRRQQEEAARRAAEEAARQAAAAGSGGGGGGGSSGGGGGSSGGGGGGGGGGAPSGSSSGWGSPLAHTWVTEEFGGSRNHGGIDFGAAMWTPIYAAAAGRVSACYEFSNYGNTVDIQHPDGTMTRYAHQPYGGLSVSCGQWVERGQQIGHVGSTGWSTGPHLHFETWPSAWERVNPRWFMEARGVYF